MRATRSANGVSRRLRQEHGFTVVEVMVALFILSIGLVSLAYTASIGFGYTARARIRSDATALVNQTLEQTRGLSREVLARGMSTADLAGDPNIVNCNAGTKKCYSVSNEVIVSSDDTPSITPVNPHVTQVDVGPTTFTRRVYLTYLDTSTNATRSTNAEALHIMVVVSWPAGGGGPAGSIALDSVVENTSGCPAVDLHPFGGPCADYIVAEAEIPGAAFTIRSNKEMGPNTVSPPFLSLDGLATLTTPRLSAELSSEQAMRGTASITTSGVQKVTVTGGVPTQDSTGYVSDSSSASDGNGVPETDVLSITDVSSGSSPLQIGPKGSNGHDETILVVRKAQTDSPLVGGASTYQSCVTPLDTILGCAYAEATVRDGNWTSASGSSYSDATVANLVVKYRSGATLFSLGDCRVVHTDTGGISSVYVHRTSAIQVEVVLTRRLPRMALGCIPAGIPRPAGYDDARGLLQLRGLVETATVEIGTEGLAATVD